MKTYYWTTEQPHTCNTHTMCQYLEEINTLEIIDQDGTYAEVVDDEGQKWGLHASGNGDFFSHKIEFEKIESFNPCDWCVSKEQCCEDGCQFEERYL